MTVDRRLAVVAVVFLAAVYLTAGVWCAVLVGYFGGCCWWARGVMDRETAARDSRGRHPAYRWRDE